MNTIGKLLVGAAMAGGLAVTAAAPAQAGISVGIGIGVPGPGDEGRWCYYHPRACGGYNGPVVEGGFVVGHGYWHGHRWWGRREWHHGGWRYR